jgi:UDP-GlcNAc:undecaprenyl-phosphate GlcNAc-1-phosphate transferase
VSGVLTPLVLRFAVRRKILDLPGGHKSHSAPVPYLGGVAIVGAFVLVLVMAVLSDGVAPADGEFLQLIGIGVALALLGLIDDVRGLTPVIRLAVEVAAGLATYFVGNGSELTGNPVVDVALTVLWVVGLVNAVNMVDNMDGLSAGLVGLAALGFFAVAVRSGDFLVGGLSIALAGCTVGFLRHNYHPATIYMGDAGAYFLGYLLAVVGLGVSFSNQARSVSFLVPILIVAVLLFDASLVIVSRLAHGISPMRGGRDHTSHRLVRVGLPIRVAVGLIHVAGASAGTIGFVASQVPSAEAWVLMGLVLLHLMLAALVLIRVPVYENSRWPLFEFSRSRAAD